MAICNTSSIVVSTSIQSKLYIVAVLLTRIDMLFPEVLTIRQVLKSIDGVVKEWFRLGLELGVPQCTLEAIEYDHRNDVEACKRKMVQQWLKQPCPSWCSLVEALNEIGMKHMAHKLSEKYSTSKFYFACNLLAIIYHTNYTVFQLQRNDHLFMTLFQIFLFSATEVSRVLQNSEIADTEITDEFIEKFTIVVGSMWPLLASLLSFTTDEIWQVKNNVTGVPSVKAAAMMKKWRDKTTATYGILTNKVKYGYLYSGLCISLMFFIVQLIGVLMDSREL